MNLYLHNGPNEGLFIPLSLCTRLLDNEKLYLARLRKSYSGKCHSKVTAYGLKGFINLLIMKRLLVQNFAIKNMIVSYYITITTLTHLVFRILPPLVYKSSSNVKIDSVLYLNVKSKDGSHMTFKFAQNINYTNLYVTGHVWLFHAIEYNIHDAVYQLNITPSAQVPTSQCRQFYDQNKYQKQWIGNRSMLFLAIHNTCGHGFYAKRSLYFLMFKRIYSNYDHMEKLHLKILFSLINCTEQNNSDIIDMLTVSYYNTPQITLNSYFMKHKIIEGTFIIDE